jgi:hypothetical protein
MLRATDAEPATVITSLTLLTLNHYPDRAHSAEPLLSSSYQAVENGTNIAVRLASRNASGGANEFHNSVARSFGSGRSFACIRRREFHLGGRTLRCWRYSTNLIRQFSQVQILVEAFQMRIDFGRFKFNMPNRGGRFLCRLVKQTISAPTRALS